MVQHQHQKFHAMQMQFEGVGKLTCCEPIQIFTCSELSAVLMCADCRNLRLKVRVQKALEASA